MKASKNFKTTVCMVIAALMIFSLCASAFATTVEGTEVEDITDAVAEREAAAEAEKIAKEAEAAAKAEEANRVNDVVDLDDEESTVVYVDDPIQTPEPVKTEKTMSGPVLSLSVGAVLIVACVIVIGFSNKKINAGKKGKR